MTAWLDNAPLWLIGLSLAAGLLLVEELAYLVRRTVALRWEPPQEGPGVGYLISAALALLGLLVAFTFSMAATHHDLRTQLVVEEANAIGAAYSRFKLLEPPDRDTLGRETLAYLELRLRTAEDDADVAPEIRTQTEAARSRIWRAIDAAVREPHGASLADLTVEGANAMFGAAAARRAAAETRVPGAILRTVLLYAMVCALLMGYGLASGGRHFAVSTALFVLVALTITLIIDIDRPRPGVVRVNSDPLQRVAEQLRRAEGAEAGSPALGEGARLDLERPG